MNRHTFLFLLLLIIFFDLPRSGLDNDSDKDGHVLATYRQDLKQFNQSLYDSDYRLGYGNLTGLKLSYQDAVENRNALLWPFRSYTKKHPWTETQKDSLLPDEVSTKVRLFWGVDPVSAELNAYLLNITGDAYGEFNLVSSRGHLTPVKMDLPPYLKEYYNSYRQARYDEEKQRYEEDPENNMPPTVPPENTNRAGNITTYDHGKINVRIHLLASVYPEHNVQRLGLDLYEDATVVYVTIELTDVEKTDRNEFSMFAVYFQETGSLVGLTKSAKFRGNHALPHFTMNMANFNKSKVLMERLLKTTNLDKDISLDDVTNNVEISQSHCELVSYFQLKKTAFTRSELVRIDNELKLREGLPLPKHLPQIEIEHALIYSPDCGLVFEDLVATPFVGIRSEVQMSRLRIAFIGLLVLSFVDLRLFLRQAEICRTPSHLSNISTFCLGLLSGYDLIVAMMLILIMWITDLYLICASVVIINVLLFYVIQFRYLSTIEATQANERGISWWEILRGSTQNPPHDRDQVGNAADVANEAQNDAQNTPVENANAQDTVNDAVATEAPTVTAETLQPNGQVNNIMSYFAISFVFSFGIVLLFLKALSWSLHALRVCEYIFLLLLNSYWIPQFSRNTLKNRSKSLPWDFVLGTSIVRIVPIVYLTVNENNALRHPRNPLLLATLVAWLGFQIFLLYLQSRLGARFWLNSKWLPEQYNYHPLISVKDLESGFSLDILTNIKPNDSGVGTCENDCAICMSVVTFPVLMTDGVSGKGYEALMQDVMITPCHHLFHKRCLEDWMIYKLQCPVCRSSLPPL